MNRMSEWGAARGCLVAVMLASARVFAAAGQDIAVALPDLAGRWVMVQVMPALTSLPLVGDVTLTTISAAFVEIEQSGTSLQLRDTACFTDVEITPGVASSRVPAAFIASLCPAPRCASLEWRDDAWWLVQPPVVDVRGATIEDPSCTALPTEAGDPRVWDQDGDGHPGLTVEVTAVGLVAGETYVVQRLEFALLGRIANDDAVSGSMSWMSEQNVVGASNPLLLLAYEYEPHPDPSRSVFVMLRAASSWTCETIRELLPDLLTAAGA